VNMPLGCATPKLCRTMRRQIFSNILENSPELFPKALYVLSQK
jgi:hypothetical protein